MLFAMITEATDFMNVQLVYPINWNVQENKQVFIDYAIHLSVHVACTYPRTFSCLLVFAYINRLERKYLSTIFCLTTQTELY